ncbi:MAG: hypothetical protein Q4A74_03505 [Cardiobacteriaceae bacterium]|nr:hypothetical protein [Cardiobacteriaceae bacterium]
MGIYRCNYCKHISEYAKQNDARPVHCQQCGQEVVVYDTVYFVEALLKRYTNAVRELQAMREASANQVAEVSSKLSVGTQAQGKNILNGVSWSESDVLANAAQHQPLADWFKRKGIRPEFDYNAVNMSGYYDEAASMLGDNYPLLKDLLGKIS